MRTASAFLVVISLATLGNAAEPLYETYRGTADKLINAALALGASRALILRAVILPGSLPIILTGARISLAFAWGSIIAAELAMGIKVTAGGSGAWDPV